MRRRALVIPAAFLGLAAAVLAACGGGSSSTTGPSASGGSGAGVVQGQVLQSPSASLQESRAVVVLRRALGIGVAEAAAGDPVADATVTLTCTGGTFTTKTDVNGNFIFQNVPPGTCTLQVTTREGVPLLLTGDTSFVIGAGDTATIAGTVREGRLPLTAVVTARDFSNVLQNDAQLAHAINIALATNRSLEEVIAFRQAGHGWGQVARHFGAHPSVVGLGADRDQMEDARAKNGKGKAKGKGRGAA